MIDNKFDNTLSKMFLFNIFAGGKAVTNEYLISTYKQLIYINKNDIIYKLKSKILICIPN